MKNLVKGMLIGAASVTALLAAAEDKTILDLNFDNGLESGVYEFGTRGGAALIDEEGHGKVLKTFDAAKGTKRGNGVVLRGEAAKEFTPEAFTWSLKFKYTGKAPAELTKGSYNFLLDCRYRGKTAKGGMTANLVVSPKATNLVISLTYKDGKSGSFTFKVPTAVDGKWHDISITAASPKLTLKFDDQTFNRVMLGVPAPAPHRLVIGDCVGSSYGPFNGLIDDVKLTVPATPAATEAPAAK
ncbi:MAG: hypothetical protein E7052_08690 [Lentisphaerae bacterium]|nr:hypothetical protein [Lentisphaerota bacterium]